MQQPLVGAAKRELAHSRAMKLSAMSVMPLAASVRLAERAGLIGSAGADRLPPPALNAVLAGIFGAEAGLLRLLSPPFGLSLLLIARKTGAPGG